MKKIPLKELATITAGQSAPKPELFSKEGFPFVRAGSLEELIAGKKESDLELISIDIAEALRLRLYPAGSILFAKSGMSATKNRFYQLKTPAYVVSHLAILIPKDCLFVDYIRHVLIKYPPSSLIKDLAYPAISLGDIQDFKVPVPDDSDDQIRIATLLSKVENLISRRREQLKQLDELLKSVFLEMFGDPVRNEKRWEKKKIIEFACVKIGPFGSLLHVSDYISNGIPLINPSHIVKGEIRPDSSLTITSTMFNELTSYHLSENDIVVARRGEIGRCALVRDSAKLLCGTGSMFIRIESGYVPDFLQFQIFRTSLKDLLLSKSKGVTMQNLNSTTLETLHVIFPPLDLQKQFAAIIHKVENIKSSYQQSLDELKFLYGTLSQKAFKGELDLSLVRLVEEGESLTRITSESSNSESSY